MGDIGTHAKIGDQIIGALKTVRDNEDYIFFEVGNWFTDTSQMRDPFAHISGKKVIWDIGVKTAHKENVIANFPALAEMVLDLSYELDNYLDELMGRPGPAGGLLAQYFLDFFFIDGLEKFRRQGVDPDEFEELFRPSRSERAGAPVAIMTQYYPHEHVDFPPWPFHDIVGERKPSQAALHQCPAHPAAGSGRRLYQYTEDQLVYLSDLYTLVEHRWAKLPEPDQDTDETKRDRHYVLARFGHASHALEDFFFHSNFTECAWRMRGQPLPDQSAAPDSENRDQEEDKMNPEREKRIFFRRLRAPLATGETLNTEKSDDINQVFTGYFASKDMFHTIADGIKGLVASAGKHGHLAPMAEILNRFLDRDELTEEQKKKRNQEHKKALESGLYPALARADGKLHPKSIKSLERMCQMDLDLWKKYPKVDLGIFGMVMTFLDQAQAEHVASEKRSADLDQAQARDPAVANGFATDNGASAENVGSHSLMAKDSDRKHPLRQQAFNLATGAAVYAACRMVEDRGRTVLPVARSTKGSIGVPDGGAMNTVDVRNIDWLHLLQHFVSHPAEAEKVEGSSWWQIQMDTPDASKTGHMLQFIDDPTAELRMKEKMRSTLEAAYNALAEQAESEWRTTLAKVKGGTAGLIAGAVLGAVAGAIAGAMLGSALGPAGAIVGGILGGIIGAVVGGLLGALVGGAIGSLF